MSSGDIHTSGDAERSELSVFAFLLNTSGAIMLIVYLITALAQIRLRRQLERDSPKRLTVRMWLFPYATQAAIVAMVAVLTAMAFTEDLASQLYASLLCFAIVVIAYGTKTRLHLNTWRFPASMAGLLRKSLPKNKAALK